MNFAITGKKIVSTQPDKRTSMKQSKVIQKIIKKPIINSTIKKPLQKNIPPKVQVKQSQLKKNQIKKQQKVKQSVKIQEKKQEKKIQQSEVKLQIKQQPKIMQPVKISQIIVRYNHYKDKFPTQNNILKYPVIEDKYTFASVFKGNYLPTLRIYRNYKEFIQPLTSGTALEYTWLIQQGKQYQITIAQDEQQQSKYERKAYIAPKQQQKCPIKRNKKVQQLTKQMRNMAVDQLGTQKHKQLLEQRALQEVLFS